MASVWRDPSVGREVALSAEQLRAWLTHASYHARLAVSIAALAPKLRQANILALRWDTALGHVDPALIWITVTKHKTAARIGKPLVIPISAQLQRILADARRRQHAGGRDCPFVVQYRGRGIASLRHAVQAAAAACRAALRSAGARRRHVAQPPAHGSDDARRARRCRTEAPAGDGALVDPYDAAIHAPAAAAPLRAGRVALARAADRGPRHGAGDARAAAAEAGANQPVGKIAGPDSRHPQKQAKNYQSPQSDAIESDHAHVTDGQGVKSS